jgi:hypothetical protein
VIEDTAAHLDRWGSCRQGDLLFASRTATVADRLLADAV